MIVVVFGRLSTENSDGKKKRKQEKVMKEAEHVHEHVGPPFLEVHLTLWFPVTMSRACCASIFSQHAS